MSKPENELRQSMRTHFVRKDLPPPRPSLAENVVCMFSDERPPVQQALRRGRRPKAVVSLSNERHKRFIANLPKRHEFQLGDVVEVEMGSGEWVPATIIRHLSTLPNGTKRFRLIGYKGWMFNFGDFIDQYCEAFETRLRPA